MKVDKKAIALGFKEAKRYLKTSDNIRKRQCHDFHWTEYICHAIDNAREEKFITSRTCKLCWNVIRTRLDGSDTVTHWLLRNGYIDDLHDWESIQDYRHRWLDSLILEYSS